MTSRKQKQSPLNRRRSLLAGQPRLDRVEMLVCGLLSQFYTPWSLGFKSHKPLAESAQRGPFSGCWQFPGTGSLRSDIMYERCKKRQRKGQESGLLAWPAVSPQDAVSVWGLLFSPLLS